MSATVMQPRGFAGSTCFPVSPLPYSDKNDRLILLVSCYNLGSRDAGHMSPTHTLKRRKVTHIIQDPTDRCFASVQAYTSFFAIVEHY